MITIENLEMEDLLSVIMNVNDIINNHICPKQSDKGLQLTQGWITPESCYHLYKFLRLERGSCLVSERVIEALKQGTTFPDELQ